MCPLRAVHLCDLPLQPLHSGLLSYTLDSMHFMRELSGVIGDGGCKPAMQAAALIKCAMHSSAPYFIPQGIHPEEATKAVLVHI